MSTVIIRPRKRDRDRAMRDGWMTARFPWPDGSVSAEQRYPGEAFVYTYETDIQREKVERMERALWYKREPDAERRAIMLHVFYVGGSLFTGWWTYLIGINDKRYAGGGYKHNVVGSLMTQARELFPLVLPGLHDDLWMEVFARRYQRRTRFGRPEGMAPVWGMVHGDDAVSIDAVAQNAGGYIHVR
jgi:hypothetical protein